MHKLYYQNQIKKIDNLASEYLQISSFGLMQKAGAVLYNYIKNHKNIMVVAGIGNNAGDGYVIANLALKQGINVTLWGLVAIEDLPNDAQMAAKEFINNGGSIVTQPPSKHYDCIVDGIFGTGLNREITGDCAKAINWINATDVKTYCIDMPSGLHADTGCILGVCVKADVTIAVICYKPGLFTHHAKDQCGQLFLEDLDVPQEVFAPVETALRLLNTKTLKPSDLYHHHNSHKGSFGQVLIVGGSEGMLGAIVLSAKAALRSGCGTVQLISGHDEIEAVALHHPELMTASTIEKSVLLKSSKVLAIGPGIGLSQQAKITVQTCIDQQKLMVIDADALSLISGLYQFDHKAILTPHPKEAASLLNSTVEEISSDRIGAALKISQRYQACVVLKGSGTVVANNQEVYLCPFGYSGMATAGMGDVLTGIIASFVAQGLPLSQAAITGVVIHAIAAQQCEKGNGLIASDVIEKLPHYL